MTLDIGIVGAGFAGTAAALFLSRAGHRVTLYEEAEEPAAIGAGILIQPTGMSVLAELGLLAGALERGSRVQALRCVTAAGRTVLDLHYAELAPDLFGLGMHRGALFELLLGRVREQGVTLHCGRSIRRSDELADAHELVVVADGARSELREALRPRSAKQYPWGAVWFVGKDPEQRFAGVLHQVCDSTTTLLGLLPSGRGPAASDGTPRVSLFWSLRAEHARRRSFDLGVLKARVRALEPRADALLDQITDKEQLLPAVYFDVVMRDWHEKNVVFIGDAAHATSPQLGQGCNLALQDARTLADCLANEATLSAALTRYSHERRRQLRYYQWASRTLTPFFQSRHASLGLLRDAFMGPLCQFALTQRLMLGTLAGVQLGLLGPTLPLESVR